jgi:hypothetical protein
LGAVLKGIERVFSGSGPRVTMYSARSGVNECSEG